jgi:hypothetical protein
MSEPKTQFHKPSVSFGEMLKENYYDEMYHNQDKYGSLMREQINSIMNDEWYEDNKQQMEKTCPDLLAYVDAFRSGAKRYPAGLQREYNRADEAAKVKTKCEEQLKIATANLASLITQFNESSPDAAADLYQKTRGIYNQILKLPCFDKPKILTELEDDFNEMQQKMKDITSAEVHRYEPELDAAIKKYDEGKTVENYDSVFEISEKIRNLNKLKSFINDGLLDKPLAEYFANKYGPKLRQMNLEQPRAGGKKRSKSKKSLRKMKSKKSRKSRKTKSRRH